ncbi:MAG: TolC family protein [Bacteriovoracaceae bacterium]|nr:TolC family protein [Bacteriovoracaceae bacterium]
MKYFFSFICKLIAAFFLFSSISAKLSFSQDNQTQNNQATDLNLKAALNEMNLGSFDIKKETAGHEEDSAKVKEARAAFLPTLGLNITDLFETRYAYTDVSIAGSPSTIPQIIPNSSFSLNATLPIFDGWMTSQRYAAAKSFESSSMNSLEWSKFKNSRLLILQFYKVIGREKLVEVSKQNVITLEDHLKNISLIKKVGSATNFDVLKVEVQLSEAKAEVLNSEDNVVMEKNKLAEIMGRSTEDRKLGGDLPHFSQSTVSHILNSLSNETREDHLHRLDLISLQSKLRAYEHLNTAAQNHWIPRIYLFGQYQSYNNRSESFSDFDKYRDAYQVGVTLSWTIFDGLASTAKSEIALQQKIKMQVTLQEEQTKTKQNLELWKRKFQYYHLLSQSKSEEVKKSTESLRLAKAGARVGTRTNKDLLDAENELYRAKAAEVEANTNAIDALIQLELTSGRELYTFSTN